jgi:DNA integrity scanning protein DisA with diadenylate cyclase activity
MSDIISISERIDKKIAELGEYAKRIRPLIDDISNAEEEFEKKYAKTLMLLKNGIEFELDGVKIINPPAASVKEIARGICFKEKVNVDKTELLFRGLMKTIDILTTQMDGLRSQNKYLE